MTRRRSAAFPDDRSPALWRLILILGLSTGLASKGFAQTTEFQYLSGTDKDNRVDWEFRIDRGMQAGVWTTIPVPSNWELEGFGVYNYGRGQNEPSDETGTYRHTFSVPAAWSDRVVRIVFEGSMTDTEVRINGESAGPVHQGSFYRFHYDIGEYLNYGGENQLEVTVRNWSANPSVNAAERRADFWIFGGIFRPVYLQALPAEHIDWTAIDARADGSFQALVYLGGTDRADRVRGQITTLDGEAVGQPFESPLVAGADSVRLGTQLDAPALWSPEFPHRYRVHFTLLAGERQLHRKRETFGFRTIELRPRDGIYVNGARVVFRGVNRHSSWPESGRTTSHALSVQDVELMKDMNMNAVRMSHYPPDKHFLEACDSLGLLVIDELTGWQDAYDTEVGTKLVRELVTDDVNHPSIVLWANGNEGGFNFELDDDFHRYDLQRRPVIHPWATFGGTDTHHYIDYNCCTDAAFHSREIFFPTEFLHGLYDGGLGAGLEDYWNAIRAMPTGAGGFLWVFADEGIRRRDLGDSLDTWGSNAPDGIVGPYREKEGSFFTIKEIWSPVQVSPPSQRAYFDGSLRVENRFLYTNLNQCTFRYAWLRYPGPLDADSTRTLHAYQEPGPDLEPGGIGRLQLAQPRDWEAAHALSVEALDPHGRNLFTWVFPLQGPDGILEALVPEAGSTPSLSEAAGQVVLRSGAVEARIDTESGRLSSWTHRGQALPLSDGPRLDPEVGAYTLADWAPAADGSASVAFRFQPDAGAETRGTDFNVTYTMLPDGWLRIDFDYQPPGGRYDFLGVNFQLPETELQGLRWLGRGPYRVWKNRMRGPVLGVWEKAYNNTVTGASGWTYPEFKGYHADLHWALFQAGDNSFVLATETPGLFLRLYTPDPPPDAFNDHTDGRFPEGDISLMHAIPPIGTKFKSPDRLGPAGQPHHVNPFRDKVRFQGTIYLRPR